MEYMEIRHAHLFCGLGGGAKGFNNGRARYGNIEAKFRCLGGVDVDKAALADFSKLSGVPGTYLDMFDRDQYIAFHGQEPPKDWHEAMPDDLRRAFGYEHPHIGFLSPPCKGLSGLLSESKSRSAKYQALNRLTLRGIWLFLEAYQDDPVELIILENVPRIATRGRHLLDQITALLRSYGYAVAETTHDCGQIGGLAQSRKRFLLVARYMKKVPSYLYEPHKRPLLAVGDILGRMPVPGFLPDGNPYGGAMHRIPKLQWKTWVRLAFVEAGSDWRSLNRLAVEDGFLRDYNIIPEKVWQDGVLGVLPWGQHSGTITGKSGVTTGRFAIADVRAPNGGAFSKYAVAQFSGATGSVVGGHGLAQGACAVADPRTQELRRTALGVIPYSMPDNTVTSRGFPLNGAFAVADQRFTGAHHSNVYRVVSFDSPGGTVTAGGHPSSGGQNVADPRIMSTFNGKFTVADFNSSAGTVLSNSTSAQGAYPLADPRTGWDVNGKHSRSGMYGVLDWGQPAKTISGHLATDNGYGNVADPRMPEQNENCVAVIRALDGTWHRPFTTLELAALQGLLDPEEQFELDGLSDSAWRERIGNAVPPPAAAAIAGVMGEVLLLTWAGETFSMSSQPIWVKPVAAALMSAQ